MSTLICARCDVAAKATGERRRWCSTTYYAVTCPRCGRTGEVEEDPVSGVLSSASTGFIWAYDCEDGAEGGASA